MAKDKQNITQEICMFAHFAMDCFFFFQRLSLSISSSLVCAALVLEKRRASKRRKKIRESVYAKASLKLLLNLNFSKS